MAEKSGASSRNGTPLLWGSNPASSGLTFNASDVPNLLMPFATPVQQPLATEDEVDHFMGQEPPVTNSGAASTHDDSSFQVFHQQHARSALPSSLFNQPHVSEFVVGFGSVPPAANTAAAPVGTQQTVKHAPAGSYSSIEAVKNTGVPQQSSYYGSPQQSTYGGYQQPNFGTSVSPSTRPPTAGISGNDPVRAGLESDSNRATDAVTTFGNSQGPALFPGLSSFCKAPAVPEVLQPQPSQMTQQFCQVAPPSYQGTLPSSLRSASLPSLASAIPASQAPASHLYRPVQHHWFYKRLVESKVVWTPFSRIDSTALEKGYLHCQVSGSAMTVSTDGGRYDVDILSRRRCAVYWSDEEPALVRRCSWFYKDEFDHKFVPYEEDFAARLEDEYRNAVSYNIWHKRLEFPGDETIVMHNPNVVVHFRPSSQPDEWGTAQQGDQSRPLVVKRGAEEVDSIPTGEPLGVDHLLFVVQGIGPVCDLRFRTLTECVDDIRTTAQKMIETHYKTQREGERVLGRIEFLPVRWHEALRACGGMAAATDDGVNSRLQAITPDGVRKLRQFSNETLLDLLFYTSPFYSQKIVDQVAGEMNRMYTIFLQRNPTFFGEVSVAGHSLGALILFDILSHQGSGEVTHEAKPAEPIVHPTAPQASGVNLSQAATASNEASTSVTVETILKKLGLSEFAPKFLEEKLDIDSLMLFEDDDWKELGLPLGPRKKLKAFLQEQKKMEQADPVEHVKLRQAPPQPINPEPELSREPVASSAVSPLGNQHTSVSYEAGYSGGVGRPACKYPQLTFNPASFFALGSPVAMFLTVRGVGGLSASYHLPTCQRFFNIFHPYDPVAYRMEPLVAHPGSPAVKPVLIPHHKGRKRMHLELKEGLSRMGSDLKQKLMQSLRSTWHTIQDFALAHRAGPTVATPATPIQTPAAGQLHHLGHDDIDNEFVEAMAHLNRGTDETSTSGDSDAYSVGQLNGGRRLDYVLQEGPLESFNEYLFSLASHVCYWESEDTALMMVREVYSAMNVQPDERVPSAPPVDMLNVSSSQHQQLASQMPPPLSVEPSLLPSAGPRPSIGLSAPPTGMLWLGGSSVGVPMRVPGPNIPLASNFANAPVTSAATTTSFMDPMGPPPMSGFVARNC